MSLTPESAWDNTAEESAADPDSAVTSGSGGGVMDLWTSSRQTVLNTLSSFSGDNKSSYPYPSGLTAETAWDNVSDKHATFGADGAFFGSDKLPLEGTLSVTASDGSLLGAGSNSKTPYPFVAADPPTGVTQGADVSSPGPPSSFDVTFEPKAAGLTYTQENQSPLHVTLAPNIYGKVSGTVTNALGDPIGGVTVYGTGGADESDEAGEYALLSPSGQVALTSLEGTLEKDALIQSGGGTTVDFQAAGVRVRVVLPTGKPAENVPVVLSYTGTEKETDGSGEAVWPTLTLGLTGGNVTIGGLIEESISTGSEGSLVGKEISLGGVVRGTVIDGDADAETRDVDVRVETDEGDIIAGSGDDGGYVGGLTSNNWPIDATVVFGANDPRYVKREETVTLTQGNVEDLDVDLVRALTPTQVK